MSELRGEARRLYETWRDAGYSEADALVEVERSGVVVEQEMTELFESMGLSSDAAKSAARGRGEATHADPFAAITEMFRGMGLSESMAETAAIGRDGTQARARRAFAEAVKPTQVAPLPKIIERFDELRRQGKSEPEARRQALREVK